MHLEIRSAQFADPDVRALLVDVHGELSERYGGTGDDTPIASDDFTAPNGAFFVADDGAALVGCAGWRRHGDDAELKRMFTAKSVRGKGLGRRMLTTIENSARAAGCRRVILETGDKQPEAIALYESAGYSRIEDFGFYAGHDSVLSYAKDL
ncbi:N-acetyltransferase [Paractinoplanes abujensis]|uniref:GNAT superfamily N-acetyltransferase n=1 Tax=Paractinoplanes abujensis TaxID=882441 RepID=A0A7W7CZ05_9ACTN|nr:GNAT family N-acetyltransferase [Actinoplanes abujensis]MBB4697227.1 GNAT superfamily N-acetyltransferase [Actinoplanes abujensis]GID18300.1 N-acetyltransferase [Actinoplanes abujensis]